MTRLRATASYVGLKADVTIATDGPVKITDGVTVTDVVGVSFPLTPPDSVTPADVIAKALQRTIVDAVTISDSISGVPVIVTETASISETIAKSVSPGAIAETVATADSPTKTVQPVYTETVTASDTPTMQITDGYFSNVALLLHGNGTNGSTTFTDSSANAMTVTANGNAAISTTQSKFGGGSMGFDGSGDYLTVPDSATFAFGSGDFTVEFFVYLTAAGTNGTLFLGQWSTPQRSWTIAQNNISTHQLQFDWSTTGSDLNTVAANMDVSTGQWVHIAAERYGSTVTLYVNGVSVASTTISGSLFDAATPLYVGRNPEGAALWDMNGYIDELRVTKGVARYRGAFTPPATAFPDS